MQIINETRMHMSHCEPDAESVCTVLLASLLGPKMFAA